MQLDENSPKIIQPLGLNGELMQHQKTAVYAMKKLETQRYVDIKFRYFDNEEKDLRLETSLGILGDKVGAGKTLEVITLLLESEKPMSGPCYYASDKYVTIKEIENKTEILNLNVIMVPSEQIQDQWVKTFEKFVKQGTLEYISHINATTRKELSKINEMKESDVLTVICNDNTINDLIELSKGKKWNRFIIDEADTIQFAKIDKIRSSFIWLVTGTKTKINQGICHSKKKYIKEIFGKNISWQPDFLTIKNKDEYVEMSLNLPKPNRIVINCLTPIEIRLLAEHIPKNVMNMINAGNSDEAIRTLNCHIDTTDNIYKVIERNYMQAIENKEIELEAEKKKKYKTTNNPEEHERNKRVKRLETVIERLKTKLKSMKNALYCMNDEMCPVCMGEFNRPTIVDCCAHKYCFDCLALTLANTYNKCPVCQTIIHGNKMHIIGKKTNKKHKVEKARKQRDKMDELLDIVRREGKYLIFADYDQTFEKIKQELEKHSISYGILKGSGTKINTTLKDFENGSIRVIMLNAKNFGAGMNLQCASDIVMYHRFTKEMEEQIIGRGQRLGRQGTLNVHYLIHENENDSFNEDYFQMNEISHQEFLERIGDID